MTKQIKRAAANLAALLRATATDFIRVDAREGELHVYWKNPQTLGDTFQGFRLVHQVEKCAD